MQHLSQFMAAFWILLLGGTACAPVPGPTLASTEVKPTVIPTLMAPTATAVPVTYESSLPAVLWGEKN